MTQAQPIPQGMHTITPHLICAGATDAIAFYKKAFGAEELSCLAGADGKVMNAMIQIGDSRLMLVDEFPEWRSFGPRSLKGTPVTLHLYVEDVDTVFQRALDAGASIKMPVNDMFWGDRYGIVEDPFGHLWSIATHVRDLSQDEIRRAMPDRCPDM